MDFNRDGKTDGRDYGLYKSMNSSGKDGGSSGGSGGSVGCVTLFFLGAIALKVLEWFIKLLS